MCDVLCVMSDVCDVAVLIGCTAQGSPEQPPAESQTRHIRWPLQPSVTVCEPLSFTTHTV